MSMRLTSRIWDYEFTGAEQAVLQAMADHAKDDGTDCYPSQALVAYKARLSIRQVRRILQDLAGRGIIEVVKGGGHGQGDRTEFRIHLDRAEKRIPFDVWREQQRHGLAEVKGDTMSPKKADAVSAKKEDSSSPNLGDTMSAKPEKFRRTSATVLADIGDTFRRTSGPQETTFPQAGKETRARQENLPENPKRTIREPAGSFSISPEQQAELIIGQHEKDRTVWQLEASLHKHTSRCHEYPGSCPYRPEKEPRIANFDDLVRKLRAERIQAARGRGA